MVEQPFNCDMCDNAFSNSVNLKYCLTTHTGEWPFKCEM